MTEDSKKSKKNAFLILLIFISMPTAFKALRQFLYAVNNLNKGTCIYDPF